MLNVRLVIVWINTPRVFRSYIAMHVHWRKVMKWDWYLFCWSICGYLVMWASVAAACVNLGSIHIWSWAAAAGNYIARVTRMSESTFVWLTVQLAYVYACIRRWRINASWTTRARVWSAQSLVYSIMHTRNFCTILAAVTTLSPAYSVNRYHILSSSNMPLSERLWASRNKKPRRSSLYLCRVVILSVCLVSAFYTPRPGDAQTDPASECSGTLLVRPRERERERKRERECEWAACWLSCVTACVGDHEVHDHTFYKLAIVVAIAIVSQAIIMPLGLLLSQWKLAIYKWGTYPKCGVVLGQGQAQTEKNEGSGTWSTTILHWWIHMEGKVR